MRYLVVLAAVCAAFSTSAANAETTVICTVVADAATGKSLKQEGKCDTQVTAASTFKIAISLMGFDSGFLKDEHAPALPFRKGYPDWIASWKATTDPTSWIKNSVVWYSQQVTRAIGEKRFQQYVTEFHYGNADVSGDPGKNNGLTRAWLSSSLKISPLEQIEFLQKLVRRELPVSAHAYDMTAKVTDNGVQPSGWHVYGKTGSGPLKKPDGTFIAGRAYGWFVGWAVKDGRTVIFARLIQDNGRQAVSPGLRAREALMRDLFSTPGAF